MGSEDVSSVALLTPRLEAMVTGLCSRSDRQMSGSGLWVLC